MRMHLCYIRLLLTVMCLVGCIGALYAQSNPYKIDDELYAYYAKAFRIRTQQVALAMADTLVERAQAKGDLKAECMAMAIPLNYYFYQHDAEGLAVAVAHCKETALRNGYTQYYYHAYTMEINNLLNMGRHMAALKMTEQMRVDALEREDKYGFFCCLRTLGNLYFIRQEYNTSVLHFKEALEYMQKNLPDQDVGTIASTLSNACFNCKVYDEALHYAEMAVEVGQTEKVLFDARLVVAKCYYQKEQYERFRSYFDQYIEHAKPSGYNANYVVAKVYRLAIDGRYEEAHRMADRIKEKLSCNNLHQILCYKEGRYKEAYEYLRQNRAKSDSVRSALQMRDLAELSAELENEKLKHEAQALQLANTELNLKNTQLNLQNTELDLENTQLTLRNTELDLSELRSRSELDRINAEKNELLLEKRDLELSKLKATTDQQKLISNGIFFLALLVVAAAVVYILQHRRSERLLRLKNQQLDQARERAEESERMKTIFMQNMSHEIRTPLNSIVGFSELLATPGMELDDEDKAEYSTLIKHNSELLSTLINDVLDLSSLESGRYSVNLAPTRVNAVCHQSIATVIHNVPQGVRLYFTTEVEDDFQIETDANRLQQVLVNYLTNAEKHTDQGEIHLHCSLSERPGHLTFSVTDTGEGIPESEQEHIFERFKKLNIFKQGTGLGLNICRLIAKRLQGEARLDTTYKGGARFLFILPLKQVQE